MNTGDLNFSRLLYAVKVFALFWIVSFSAMAEDDPHVGVFSSDQFPSATKCGGCHQQVFEEWATSNHAYASISPMFHKFEQAINNLAPTISHFCVRCHQSVGTTLGEDRSLPLWERSQVSREGVTCVTCHRVKTAYGKVNGERRLEPGEIFEPVYGATDSPELDKVIANKDYYKVKTEKGGKGKDIHTDVIKFEQLNKSEFCVSCHQVAVNLGIALEVVWNQYRASPANAEGISCQDCHTGSVPGRAEGYDTAPVAVVAGKPIEPGRKHTNHSFYGPGYSIAHPGIFPHSPDGSPWTIDQLLQFDWRAGWGSSEFEQDLEDGMIKAEFPEDWSDRYDREDAWQFIQQNIERLKERDELRKQVMENGTHLDGPFFGDDLEAGDKLKFHYVLKNLNKGHNMPSGSLGAQPELWLNVALIDPDGKRVWESGYVDSYGDMADLHSKDVREGKIPHDDQLFNLQTKFLTTNVKGTDREMYLPVNFDIDQLPMLRPAAQPVTVMNHPPLVRMEGRSIPPLGKRKINYSVPGKLLKKPGTYQLAVRLRSRAEPMYFMAFVGATQDMMQSMNEGMIDIHPYTVEFEVN
ncbi:MAG: hypothetical protein ACI9G5_000468 [Paracoccaceae bacterium]|jgi:hypothetical protein